MSDTIGHYDRTGISDAMIEALARECAAEALENGAQARELAPTEDAAAGDYRALEDLIGRRYTQDEASAFRTAFSARLAEQG